LIDSKRIEISTSETYPIGFTSGDIVNFDEGPANFAPHFRMFDYDGNLLASQWSIPAGEYIPNTGDAWYVAAWFREPFNLDGGTNGDNYWPAVCWKIDDYAQQSGIYFSTSLQGPNYNSGVNYHCDLSKSSSNSFARISGFDESSLNYFKSGLLWTPNYNPEFQNGAYEGNFPADIVSYGLTANVITLAGINCHCFGYWDNAANQALPVRMAQDIYLAAIAGMGGLNNGNVPWTSVRAMPTRLFNSAEYALSIWQPGLAINETMSQYGVTSEYPELQLATIGLFNQSSGTKYYYVLPQDFVKMDITESPDLLWVSTNGQVLGVWHDASGVYYLMTGGTRLTYQSAVFNYRLPYP
jgi:hypothetical protein